MKAVILAGGFGTRFRPLTFTRPKPMLPLLNKPILEYVIRYLKGQGIDETLITTNYLRGQIIDYFGFDYHGMKLHYPVEDHPLGTAGSVKNIQKHLDETFVVIQADNITDINLRSLLTSHRNYGGLCTISVYPVDDPWNYGVVELHDSGRVKEFHEKPLMEKCTSNLINTGLYVVEPEALRLVPENTVFDFARDLFPKLSEKGLINGVKTDGFWVDVGQPLGYNKAKEWLMSNSRTYIPESATINAKVNGVIITGENVRLGSGAIVDGPVYIGDNTVVDEDCFIGPNTYLGSGVRISSNSTLTGTVVFEKTTLGREANLSKCFVAEGCFIGYSTNIQADALVGPNCQLEGRVEITQGSRIWPNTQVSRNSLVSGTLKKFVPMYETKYDPKWSLRTLSPDEAFYFNMSQGYHVMYTGFRANSLEEFISIIRDVDYRSIEYHLRDNVNDFREWARYVISDIKLTEEFEKVKREFSAKKEKVRHELVDTTKHRLDELLFII